MPDVNFKIVGISNDGNKFVLDNNVPSKNLNKHGK